MVVTVISWHEHCELVKGSQGPTKCDVHELWLQRVFTAHFPCISQGCWLSNELLGMAPLSLEAAPQTQTDILYFDIFFTILSFSLASYKAQ